MKRGRDFHSCYDELLSMLFLGNNELSSSDKYVRLISIKDKSLTTLSAHEVLLYSLLLHKCIETKSEVCTISYKELQDLRNKRSGNSKVLDNYTSKAYDKAFYGLCTKYIEYDLKETRKRSKISYRKYGHPLMYLYNSKLLENGNKIIHFSLGPFGKTLLESKRYSTLVPNKYFQVGFNEIMKYEIALYICKIIFIERRKKKHQLIITLPYIMRNVNKYITLDKQLLKACSCYEYKGANVKRLWRLIQDNANLILEQLKLEYKIKDYTILDLNFDNGYTDIRWKILLDN